MYNFVDTTTGPAGGKALPAEAMKYNGVYLEDEIPGYQTLYVSGRELMESEVQEKEITGIDGSVYYGKTYPPRTITIGYQLIAKDNAAFRLAFNKMNQILDAEQVQINFAPQSTTGFAYDAASGTYGMLRADGTAQLDANTGAQAQFDNLLVLYSASSLRDDGPTLDYALSLGGGVWLNGSQLWHITWTQGTDSTFAFYDADGRPLTIRTGRSYIALVSSVTGQELTVLDSAGQNVLN